MPSVFALSPLPDATSNLIVMRWIFRILVPLNGIRAFIQGLGDERWAFSNDALASAIGLGEGAESVHTPELGLIAVSNTMKRRKGRVTDNPASRSATRQRVISLHHRYERMKTAGELNAVLPGNIQRLSDLVGLSHVDRAILEFVVYLHNDRTLDDAADLLGELPSAKLAPVLATLLDCTEADVRISIHAQGLLARSGLVTVERSGTGTLRNKLNVLSEQFADLMLGGEIDPLRLLRETVSPAKPATLSLDDYVHVRPTVGILLPYLQLALRQKKPGVNVLLYGTPGTGKTQLTRVLAQALECELFDVSSEDGEGDAITGKCRLRAYRAAQCFFAQRHAMIVFDEMEDILADAGDFMRMLIGQTPSQANKGWITRMLEENPVPTFWLTNAITRVDPALVRRFDIVLELPIPPKSQRKKAIQAVCGDIAPPAHIARLADADALAPAVVARASVVAKSVSEALGPERSAQALTHLVSNTLVAQGHRRINASAACALPSHYDAQFIDADADLCAVAEGIAAAQPRSARLCLTGAPGTGKTAYARWLAERLDAPLHVKRGSDLISKWVGESEHNIARAFHDAEQEGAVLLLDEVDSFLQPRHRAQHLWEVTGVNEMLTQMEGFSGVFVATTNGMDGLDEAALRRFDLKVHFHALKPMQAEALLAKVAAELRLLEPNADDRRTLASLNYLTPGDFAAVLRQHRFRPMASVAKLVEALKAECAVKKSSANRVMGFVQ